MKPQAPSPGSRTRQRRRLGVMGGTAVIGCLGCLESRTGPLPGDERGTEISETPTAPVGPPDSLQVAADSLGPAQPDSVRDTVRRIPPTPMLGFVGLEKAGPRSAPRRFVRDAVG